MDGGNTSKNMTVDGVISLDRGSNQTVHSIVAPAGSVPIVV